LSSKAMRFLLDKAVLSRRDLAEVEAIPRVNEAALHVIEMWEHVVPPPPGSGTGSRGAVTAAEAVRCAQQLDKLLEASKAIKAAQDDSDPMLVVSAMREPELALVPSIFEAAVLVLSKYEVFCSAAMLMEKDINQILGILRLAEQVQVDKPIQEHLNRALETYGMLQWVFEKGLRRIADRLLREHLLKLQYVNEYLNKGKLIEWGLSEDAAAAAMADVQTIPMDSRSRPPADLSTVADVLRRAAERVPLQTLAHVFSETLKISVGQPGLASPAARRGIPPGIAAHRTAMVAWSVPQVADWLTSELDLGAYADAFSGNRIDGQMLQSLTEEDMIELGVQNRFHRRLIILRRNTAD